MSCRCSIRPCAARVKHEGNTQAACIHGVTHRCKAAEASSGPGRQGKLAALQGKERGCVAGEVREGRCDKRLECLTQPLDGLLRAWQAVDKGGACILAPS
jgi:hypothetical protein